MRSDLLASPRTPRRLLALLAGAGAAALVLTSLSPAAQADDRASAQALFDAGKLLVADGKHAEACPKFEASFTLDKTLGTLLNMADCHEKVGKLATAWAEFGEAAERAARSGDDRATFARDREGALTPRLPKLVIEIDNPRPALTVFRDEARIEPAMYGVALPVDPGKHVISVRRGEEVIHRAEIDSAEAQSGTVKLDLAAIERAAPPPPKPKDTTVYVRPGPVSTTQKTVGIVVGGVGLLAVVGAAALEIIALGSTPNDDQCVNDLCTPAGKKAADDAKTVADIGQWVGIGGLVAVAVGATLLITAPSSSPSTSGTVGAPGVARARPRKPPARALTVSPWAGPAGGGALVRGSL
jgi:hypothetical protein